MLVDVLFTVFTDVTCVVGRVLGAVWTICSVFTLCTAVIECIVFANSIHKMMARAIYNWVDIVWGLGGVCQVGWRVGCWCPRGRLCAVGDMRHSSS